MTTATIERVDVNGIGIAYRDEGSGPAVLLLHGWPTSSHLWRGVIPAIARHNRVLALDLPGFGESDKPLDARYDFELFEAAIEAVLDACDVDEVAIGAHDLGGPIALHWALRQPSRVTAIALLNTLVYPEFSAAVVEFVTTLSTPDARERLTSRDGLAEVMRRGVHDDRVLTPDVIAAVVRPFETAETREGLARAGIGLDPGGFVEIADQLPSLQVPLRVIYGECDRILPDVAETVARVRSDVPHAEVTAMPDVGHFAPEDAPELVGELLAEFFAAPRPDRAVRALGRLVGRWQISGDAKGTSVYRYLEGGFFLVQKGELERDGRHHVFTEVIGREREFGSEASSDELCSRVYTSEGDTLDYVYELEGDELTIWGGHRGSESCFRGSFSADGNTLTGAWSWPGGGYGTSATRIE